MAKKKNKKRKQISQRARGYARVGPFGLRYKKLLIRNFPEAEHAKFLVKLHADGFAQIRFFEYIISAYLKEDESLKPMLNKMRVEMAGCAKKDLDHFSNMKEAAAEIESSFGMSKEDKESIYSIEIEGMEF